MASIHTISLWLSHGMQIVTFCDFPSHFQVYCIGFFLHCCSLMAIFIRVACKLLCVMPNYCRTELPNDYSIPDGQIKVQFSSQTGARAAHGREMLNTLNTFFFAQHLKKSKIFRKIWPIIKFHPVGYFDPLFSTDLLYKNILLLNPQKINKLQSGFVFILWFISTTRRKSQWVCKRALHCNLWLRYNGWGREKKSCFQGNQEAADTARDFGCRDVPRSRFQLCKSRSHRLHNSRKLMWLSVRKQTRVISCGRRALMFGAWAHLD